MLLKLIELHWVLIFIDNNVANVLFYPFLLIEGMVYRIKIINFAQKYRILDQGYSISNSL